MRSLQKKWYDQLKAEGFRDIEDEQGQIKRCESHYFQYHYEPVPFQLQEEYYRRARLFLHDHPFPTLLEKSIWYLHSEGKPIRDIALQVQKGKNVVHGVILGLRTLMKDETPEEITPVEDLLRVRNYELGDKEFIYATWLRGLYAFNDLYAFIDKTIYYQVYPKVIETLLARPSIQIKTSVLIEDPSVILGYSVSEGDKLHWIHVKRRWQGKGIAKQLLPHPFRSVSHLTKVGEMILRKKYPKVIFNPFLF